MHNNIIELLARLRQNLLEIQKMDYTELKEKVEVINEEYKDIEDNITLNLVDVKPAISIIDEIQLELSKISTLGIEDVYRNMAFLIKSGSGGTIENDFEDAVPYDDDITYQVDRLGAELYNIKQNQDATERTGSN